MERDEKALTLGDSSGERRVEDLRWSALDAMRVLLPPPVDGLGWDRDDDESGILGPECRAGG